LDALALANVLDEERPLVTAAALLVRLSRAAWEEGCCANGQGNGFATSQASDCVVSGDDDADMSLHMATSLFAAGVEFAAARAW
jgi:hypothetical protein